MTSKAAHSPKSAEFSIADVAKATGVSVSTVSRILNHKPDVSELTRKRVLGVIRKLGYVPHPYAQRLASGKSDTIALVHPVAGEADYQLLDFILGATAVAEEQRFFFNLVTHPMSKQELRSIYRDRMVDGVILMQICLSDWRVDYLRKARLPFVMIGRTEKCDDLSYVDLDFHRAVAVVVQHLYGLGHRKIAFIRHPSQMVAEGYGPAVRQIEGYVESVRERGLPEIVRESDFTFTGSFTAAESLLAEEPATTAVISSSGDGIAGIFEAARRSGRRVPQELSVACTSCSERAAKSILPSLTSVNMESAAMGARAANMLIRVLKDPRYSAEQSLLAPQFVVRSSTAVRP